MRGDEEEISQQAKTRRREFREATRGTAAEKKATLDADVEDWKLQAAGYVDKEQNRLARVEHDYYMGCYKALGYDW